METMLYPFRYLDPLTGRWVRARYQGHLEILVVPYSSPRSAKLTRARAADDDVVTHLAAPSASLIGDFEGEVRSFVPRFES
jgi:hypothetical protein